MEWKNWSEEVLMNNNKMIIIGEKESFITIVLVKKVQEAGAECSFVPWKIDQISKNLDGVSLITLFMKEEKIRLELHKTFSKWKPQNKNKFILGQEITYISGIQ